MKPAPGPTITWPKIVPWFVAFVALGVLALWLGLAAIVPTVRAIAAGAAIVSFRARDVIALPLAIPFFALAVNALIVGATLTPDRGRTSRSKRGGRLITIMVGIGLAGAVLAMIAPLIGEGMVEAALERRGYRDCPHALALAHPAARRWARPGAIGQCAAS